MRLCWEQEARLVIEQDSSTMVREGRDQAGLQLRASFRFGKRIARGLQIVRHRTVKLGTARRTVPRKQRIVIECLSALQGCCPTIKCALANEDMHAVVDQVLRN